MGVNLDIQAALEAAAGEPEVKSPETDADASKETTDPDKGSKGKGANDRIRELVGDTKELKEKLEKLDGTVKERDTEIARLVELLEFKEKDSRVVAKMNELYETKAELKPLLEALDKAVRGEEVDLNKFGLALETKTEDGKKSEATKDTLLEAKALIDSNNQKLEAQIAEQRHELILSRADVLTEAYVKELPKEYSEDDVRLVRELLVDKIDWDAVDKNPEKLADEFKKGFEKTLKWYGTPKGAAKVSTSSDSKPKEVTPEKLDSFIKQDWGKMKLVEDAKGKKEVAEVSDADFASALGNALRTVRKLNG